MKGPSEKCANLSKRSDPSAPCFSSFLVFKLSDTRFPLKRLLAWIQVFENCRVENIDPDVKMGVAGNGPEAQAKGVDLTVVGL